MVKFGDQIKVSHEGHELSGIYIKSDGDFNVIKLSSGYNIAISSKAKIELVKENPGYAEQSSEVIFQHDNDKKRVLIIHTGGTIASKVDYATGGVISRITPEELLNMFTSMHSFCNFDTKLLSAMWSEDMRFDHYNLMAEEIKKAADGGYDGVIITHGTDTLHYTASALSFMFEDLKLPVVIVGAQKSSDRGSSDAYLNMASASKFISECDKAGVYICMHKESGDEYSHILKGVNARKMHTSCRSSFRQINSIELANVNAFESKCEFTSEFDDYNYYKELENKFIKLNSKLKIGILYLHPNMHIEEFRAYEKFDALIITSLGIGNVPINAIDDFTKEHESIYNWIKEHANKMTIVFTPQTIYGRVNQNVYSTGRRLKELNVAGHLLDMTTETAFTKLAYLLSKRKQDDPVNVLAEYKNNLRGEINKQSLADSFLR